MIPEGNEPTHAYEHWLRLQTERVVQDAIYLKDQCGTAPLKPAITELNLSYYRTSVEGCLHKGEYDSARNHCLLLAKMLIQQAAWFHRLEVRHQDSHRATGSASALNFELPTSAEGGTPNPSSQGAEQP